MLANLSFKGNQSSVNGLIQAGAMQPLLRMIWQDNLKLVEASARALKSILNNPSVPRDLIFTENHVPSFINLLQRGSNHELSNLSFLSASIIARCCDTSEQQNIIVQSGAAEPLLAMLYSGNSKAQEASMDAIGSLCRENKSLVQLFMEMSWNYHSPCNNTNDNMVSIMLQLLRDRKPSMRLVAATALTNIYRCDGVEKPEMITHNVLPCLISLFDEASHHDISEKAPLVFGYLVSENESLQKAASDADAVKKLSAILNSLRDESESTSPNDSMPHNEKLRENVLLALGAVCSLHEESRRKIIEAKILPIIVKCLESEHFAVRSAACQCIRSLSRSVKQLRTNLVDGGVALPLFKLLSDSSETVQITASAALCNIVLDFSPMKKTFMDNGGVEKAIKLVGASNTQLRLNAVWALKNLLFQADSDVKHSVMEGLTYPGLWGLLHDREFEIEEQAVNLLRNLACGKESDIDEVFANIGENELIRMLEQKLRSQSDDILVQALYVVVNISTGSERHKAAIMNSKEILNAIIESTSHLLGPVRIAAIWCIINMTWPDDAGSNERVIILRQLGFEERLKDMSEDPDIEVKERVKTALQHFRNDGASQSIAMMDTESTADMAL